MPAQPARLKSAEPQAESSMACRSRSPFGVAWAGRINNSGVTRRNPAPRGMRNNARRKGREGKLAADGNGDGQGADQADGSREGNCSKASARAPLRRHK